jgi:hypothetical protein
VKKALLLMVIAWSLPSFAQTQTICRDLKESGGFLYVGESVVNGQACRQVTYTTVAQPAAVSNAPAAAPSQPTDTASSPAGQPAAPVAPPPTKSNDGKVRLYVTDEPKDESIFLASHRSGWGVSGNSNGFSGGGGSVGSAVGYSDKGADPRTVELQADLYEKCPTIVVTNDPPRADYVLLFRREGGKRTTMFAMGGLTGLALSAHAKVDGASVFDTNGDLVFATRARTVETAIKEVCGHLK